MGPLELADGGRSIAYGGARQRAVLAAGVVLTRGTPVYDLPRQRVIRAGDVTRAAGADARQRRGEPPDAGPDDQRPNGAIPDDEFVDQFGVRPC